MPTEVLTEASLSGRIASTLQQALNIQPIAERIAKGVHKLYAEVIEGLTDALEAEKSRAAQAEEQLTQVEGELFDQDQVVEATRAWHDADHTFGLNLCDHPVCRAVCNVNR